MVFFFELRERSTNVFRKHAKREVVRSRKHYLLEASQNDHPATRLLGGLFHLGANLRVSLQNTVFSAKMPQKIRT